MVRDGPDTAVGETAGAPHGPAEGPTPDTLPLEGLRVVEFSHMVMGPATGMILADLGADVLKVEPPGGDNTRRLTGSGGGYFAMYNRNKRSLCADLKESRGRELVHGILDTADVVLENFRPGAMDRLGFGYPELSARNPRLVYCSLKGFLHGPYAERVALDEVTQMMGGLAYMTGLPGRPMRAGSSIVDITGGMFGVIAILAALAERNATGCGQRVTSALFETTAFLVGQHMAQQAVLGEEPAPMSVRRAAWGVYDLFDCADGQLFVAVVSDTQWRTFCKDFGLDALAADPVLADNAGRVAHRDRFLPMLRELFEGLNRAEAGAQLARAGMPFAEINRPSDLFEDPHLAHAGLAEVRLADGEHAGDTTRLPKLPLEMAGRRFEVRRHLPHVGEHSRQAARGAGRGTDEIDALIADGVILET
ncbi:MAG: CaiB/BaiF CoA-transferase family protein [Gammaproteobacteria bacterium]|nr:CaiB/BaiF CoA-transferase family protein [Gammaproteobacteria bacterium]MYC53477.1 CoA transferase [Gammaproteobacteria bacterium]MYJ25603.1 CoA transferase [Holophagales bacterium]